jgi:putative CocE/NonD family hydrolase
MSEGDFVNMRPHIPSKTQANQVDESSDTYDTIDWLIKNVPNHNGKVGQWGISYPGFYTSTGLIDAHPALVASSPQAPICDWFVGDDFHHNGALMLPHFFNFIADFGKPRPSPTSKPAGPRFDHGTPDGYQFFLDLGSLANADPSYLKGQVPFWNEVMTHGAYDDFWKSRNLRPHLKAIKPAVMTVGGWFDAENLYGALETYKAIENSSPGATNFLVMGPWIHGGWNRSDGDRLGPVKFDEKTSPHFQETIEFPFFEAYLKGKGGFSPSEAHIFETGRNQWRTFDRWPPASGRKHTLNLLAGGKLGEEAADSAGPGGEFDEFVSDPDRPVPFVDETVVGMAVEYMVEDQRFAARRPDVLSYQTGPLESDLTLAGPLEVELHVATTGTDADWVVKVIDVYPADFPDNDPNPTGVRMGNYHQLVRGDVFRGKFRNSFEKPEPFVPGEPARVAFTLNDICHTFRAGHRLMVQVQSTWFPLVDRNPQTFVDIYAAKPADFQKATHRVYHTKERPSRIVARAID